MSGDRIAAFIIGSPQDSQVRRTSHSLSSHFDVEIVAPVFLASGDLNDPEKVDLSAFKARHLREPLLGEVGCAMAHLSVYRNMGLSDAEWALVLEDDVGVTDGVQLRLRLEQIIANFPGTSPVIANMNARAARPFLRAKMSTVEGLWLPAVSTFTTSAYLLNQSAASLLLSRQSPVRTQADWPVNPSDVLFLQESRVNAVPIEGFPSAVDPDGKRSHFPLSLKVSMWSGLWFWRHRKYFMGLRDYWYSVLKVRIFRHLY